MTVEELIVYGRKYLHSSKVNILLASILEIDSLELLNHLNDVVDEKKIDKYKKYIYAVQNNKPIQYVVGNVIFFGYEFDINENVLIPRFETEELVDNTLKFIKEKFDNNIKVIDLGCGSGVISITMKLKMPSLDVTALDISDKALEVTNHNMKKHNVDINIVKGDMLDNIKEKYDVIISNPPYISKNEEIEDIVKDNEPEIALYAEENGYYFYEKILSKARSVLNDKYLIAFEIGYTQKEGIFKIADKYFKDCKKECLKDMSGKDRMIFIYNV